MAVREWEQENFLEDGQKLKRKKNGDLYPSSIIAIFETEGWSISEYAMETGWDPKFVQRCLLHPDPEAQKVIAKFLECSPQEIWPSRYKKDGSPK